MRLRARCLVCLVAVVFGLAWAGPAPAQVVVPTVYANAEGPGSTALPIHIKGQPWTFQMIYGQSQLTGLVGMEITGIAYRSSATPGGSYPLQQTTWSSYVIRLGPGVAPNAATGTFASNFTAAPTQVHTGSWTVPFFAWPNNGPPGPNPWGPVIPFDTPYVYTGGNLAMLITHPGSDNTNAGNALMNATAGTSPGLGTDYSYFAGQGFDVSSGASSVFMPIVEFTVQPAPEPATCLLPAAAVLGAAAALRWKRRGESLKV